MTVQAYKISGGRRNAQTPFSAFHPSNVNDTHNGSFAEVAAYLWDVVKAFGRYTSDLRRFYPMAMLLAGAAMAARGYVVLPSATCANNEYER